MIQSIVSGILQGILEWLPISSQGNLVLLMINFLGYSPTQALSFSIFLHGGTLLAVITYFRKEIKDLVLALRKYSLYSFKKQEQTIEQRTISFLLVSAIVTGAVGYPLFKFLNLPAFSGKIFPAIIGIGLIFTGISQKFIVSRGLKTQESLCLKDSLFLGIAQGFAIIPGISRSGITTSGLLLRGYKLKNALRLSFLMSIPAVLGAQVGLLITNSFPEINITEGLVSLLFSFLFGILTIHAFLKLTEKIKFWLFCLVLGIITLIPPIFLILNIN